MADGIPDLTPRERDVLHALCRPSDPSNAFTEPSTVRQIAETLVVTEAAVKHHLLRLYDKFEIFDDGRRRVALANEAIKHGFGDGSVERLILAREAFAARRWEDAYAGFIAAGWDALGPHDLEMLGEAAVWTDRHEESLDARTRAFAAFTDAGDGPGAARVALALVINHVVRVRFSVAAGWLAKAERALDGVPGCPEHGYLAVTTAMFQCAEGAFDEALASGRNAYDIALRHKASDLEALALLFQGVALMNLGRVDEGRARLDEAMASAATGDLTPFATGLVYCRTICACLDSFDLSRAIEWTEEVARLHLDRATAGFPGDCRTHQAALLALRGEWDEALAQARTACEEAASFDQNHIAVASITIGEVLLHRGDLDGADEAFSRALSLGHDAQPGIALLHLARGEHEAAAASIEAALATTSGACARARLLPAKIEIALARDDLEAARACADELDAIAAEMTTDALAASAAVARGAVVLTDNDAVAAAACLRRARDLWRRIGAPFEDARAQVLEAQTKAALGDAAAARAELEAAAVTFEQLGAVPAAERARALSRR